MDSGDGADTGYTVQVTVNGPQYDVITTSKLISVVRPPDTGLAAQGTFVPDVAFSNVAVATFTEPDAADASGEFSAVINWGDGTSSSGTVIGSNGLYQVLGGHTYNTEEPFPIGVLVSQAWGTYMSTFSLTGGAIGLALNPIIPAASQTFPVNYPFNLLNTKGYANLFTLKASTAPVGKDNVLVVTSTEKPGFSDRGGNFFQAMDGSGFDKDSAQIAVRYKDAKGDIVEKPLTNSTPANTNGKQGGATWKRSAIGVVTWTSPPIPKQATQIQIVVVYTDTLYETPDNYVTRKEKLEIRRPDQPWRLPHHHRFVFGELGGWQLDVRYKCRRYNTAHGRLPSNGRHKNCSISQEYS